MFVASYARLPPVPGSILASTFKLSLATHYIGFLRLQSSSGLGLDRLLQCAVPPRYHFITARALYYNARYRLGTARALYYNAR